MDKRPIGIFDSGLGGLTVVKEVMKQLENESIIYFGDTARVPYGSKSKETVTKFSAQIIRFLREQNVKAIIIACNTVNTTSIEALRKMFPDIQIQGVVEPGVTMALNTTKSGRIGIIGTEATIASNRYPELLQQKNSSLAVYGRACPLFVPLVEDGWAKHPVASEVAKEYLKPLLEESIDSLVLGCTHYPMLTTILQEVVGEGVALINPAKETAVCIERLLEESDMKTNSKIPNYAFYVSDRTERFKQMAELFLDYPVEHVEVVDIEKY
ncbi:MAG: glutamate racemase [Cellulosilyticaceae bacterium]